MMFIIYKITNTISKESYIGFTSKDAQRRWERHLYLSRRGSQNHFYRAIRKYGPENFRLEILEEGRDPEIGKNIREPYWISVLKPEYNGTRGGDGTLGRKMSEENRIRQSNAMLGKRYTLGYKHTEEERQARSSRMMGNRNGIHNRGSLGVRWKCTEEQNLAKSQRMMGHEHSPEAKLAMSIAASHRKKKS